MSVALLTQSELLQGAAYRIIYEKTDPDGCVDREKLSVLRSVLDGVRLWASTQPPEITLAYSQAASKIDERAETTCFNNERYKALLQTADKIPKPP